MHSGLNMSEPNENASVAPSQAENTVKHECKATLSKSERQHESGTTSKIKVQRQHERGTQNDSLN